MESLRKKINKKALFVKFHESQDLRAKQLLSEANTLLSEADSNLTEADKAYEIAISDIEGYMQTQSICPHRVGLLYASLEQKRLKSDEAKQKRKEALDEFNKAKTEFVAARAELNAGTGRLKTLRDELLTDMNKLQDKQISDLHNIRMEALK